MYLGIHKRQWQLIFISFLIPLSINFIGMWIEYGPDVIFLTLMGKQPPWLQIEEWGFKNPWPQILIGTVEIFVIIGILAWLMVCFSMKPFFQNLRNIIRHILSLLMAIFVGISFSIASLSISNIWLHAFWAGPLLGLLKSNFVVYFSARIIFPLITLLLYWAIQISGKLPRMSHA